MPSLNRKIICLVDESGTAGDDEFSLGFVFVFASEAAKLDKLFTDLLPKGFGEFHAHKHEFEFYRRTMESFCSLSDGTSLTMFSFRQSYAGEVCRQRYYARALVDGFKATARKFRRSELSGSKMINNVELILDSNSQNVGEIFSSFIASAMSNDGLFRAVQRCQPIDSSVSRLLQLADAVAYSRRLVDQGKIKTGTLKSDLGIQII